MTMVEPNLRQCIAGRVTAALDRHQPRAYRLEVDAEAIIEDDGWYHVVVRSPDDVRDREFYDALADTEAELNDADSETRYLLVPAIAE